MATFHEHQEGNRRRTLALIAAFVGLFGLIGIGLDVSVGGFLDTGGPPLPLITLLTVGFASAMSFVSYFRGSALVLASLQAAKLDPKNEEHIQLHNIVTEIALAAGLPQPQLFVIPDPAPNAMATGRDPAHAAIVVTQGALDLLDREETQGVIAHEMAHIANRDTLTMTVVGVLLGGVALLADWGRRVMYFSRGSDRRRVVLLLPLLLVVILLSPLLSRLLAMAISRQREYLADATSVEFTRNPLGLASALEKIGSRRSPLQKATRGTAHLFISDPLQRATDEREGRLADLLSTHPPLHLRIAILRSMAHGGSVAG